MSRLILASLLLVSAASSSAWAEPLTRQWLLGDLLPRMTTSGGSLWLFAATTSFQVHAAIVQPGGEIRHNQVVICARDSLKIGDDDGTIYTEANFQGQPVEAGGCDALLRAIFTRDSVQHKKAN